MVSTNEQETDTVIRITTENIAWCIYNLKDLRE